MTFISVLSKIGSVAKDFWKKAAPVIQEADTLAKDIEPEVAIAFPQFSGLYNQTVQFVGLAESSAAAAGANNAGAQKLIFVLNAIAPYIVQEATALGIKQPTVAQIKNYINGIVAALNAFEAL
jgi:hypothetical protein